MKLILSIAAALVLISCGNSALVKQIEGSDSVAVRFNYPGTDSIVKVVETTLPHAIEKLVGFVDSKETGKHNCGYNGNIMFYKKGMLTGDISFNYTTNNCHHFLHMADGKLSATSLSNEAAHFLKRLAEDNR